MHANRVSVTPANQSGTRSGLSMSGAFCADDQIAAVIGDVKELLPEDDEPDGGRWGPGWSARHGQP